LAQLGEPLRLCAKPAGESSISRKGAKTRRFAKNSLVPPGIKCESRSGAAAAGLFIGCAGKANMVY
jgi:hypothetical protein